MGAMVKEYFDNLFTREVLEFDEGILADVDQKVSVGMNQRLLAPFTREEVKKALFSIGDLKAPAPDGLHAFFSNVFGICWKMILWRRCWEQSRLQQYLWGGIIQQLS
jgi:hypothetical protein